uniref:Uncharacterized protein n=1 Tax=Strigamia maritima TaxID=126957 RepID=T1IHF4_STRMM
MLLYIFIILAVASSFAEADQYVCFDSSKFGDALHPIDVKCRTEIKSLPKRSQRLNACYIAFLSCYLRELGMQNAAKGIDHKKTLTLLKGFNIEAYLDCFSEQCPENAKVRNEFVRSSVDACD